MRLCCVGGEFRGFHIRFKDVARGGIRIVMSRNRECVVVCHAIAVACTDWRMQELLDQSAVAVSTLPRSRSKELPTDLSS